MKQHNGELKGGAKASRAGRPWVCACIIQGFKDQSEGMFQFMRFEYHVLFFSFLLTFTIDNMLYAYAVSYFFNFDKHIENFSISFGPSLAC